MMKTIVLLSGGLDSIVNLKIAADGGSVTLAITFDYGQAAFDNEQRAAAAASARCGVPHSTVGLPWYRDVARSALMGDGRASDCPEPLLADRGELLEEAWIPNRNGVFVSIAAAYAEGLGVEAVVIGANREEAVVFPDNSVDFLEAANRLFAFSTLTGVRAVSYTAGLDKKEIVERGLAIGAPIELAYSCYRRSPDQRMCGMCQSCARTKGAFRSAGVLERYAGRFAA
jgi:7-cyano-7-deazaguanine synthase